MRRKKRRSLHAQGKPSLERLGAGLTEAEVLIRRKQWSQAHSLLRSLDQRHPDDLFARTGLPQIHYHPNLGYWRRRLGRARWRRRGPGRA